MNKLLILIISVLLLTSCNEDYMQDTSPVAHDDYARIQLESDLCKQVVNEYGCLKHLKTRIQ